MDLDSDILAMIDGYVSSALGATGTKKPAPIHKPVESFEGDTIPDMMSLLPAPYAPDPLPRERAARSSQSPIEIDDETTAVNVRIKK
jgi:hypothetical protein